MPIRLTYIETRNVIMKGLKDITVTEKNKGICQQPFCAIANNVVARRFSFARSCILAENTQFRSSQQTQSGETLSTSLRATVKNDNHTIFCATLFFSFCV